MQTKLPNSISAWLNCPTLFLGTKVSDKDQSDFCDCDEETSDRIAANLANNRIVFASRIGSAMSKAKDKMAAAV